LLLLLALGVHLSALQRMVYVIKHLKADGR